MKQQSAIVLGATGLVGSEVVKKLAASEHISQVNAISRRPLSDVDDSVCNSIVDFQRLNDHAQVFQGDMLFSCLGTTLKSAGSIAAQRQVDFTFQLQAAQLAVGLGVKHYFLVSSSGANPKSLSPYLRMKGELELAVSDLPFDSIHILQPSLLLGDRADSRPAEDLGAKVLPILCRLPGLAKYRPISAAQVALKMVRLSEQAGLGLHRYRLDEIFDT